MKAVVAPPDGIRAGLKSPWNRVLPRRFGPGSPSRIRFPRRHGRRGHLNLLEPVRGRNGLVVEVGCGSGLLTRHLVEAGHRVIATDASPAMLALAQETATGVEQFAQLVLPDDEIPGCDAIVAVGHPFNYLPDEDSIDRAFAAAAEALRPGGVLAIDICDLEWGAVRQDAPNLGRVSEDWAIVTEFSMPSPTRFVRQMAVFARNVDETWRRDDERHDNVLCSSIPHACQDCSPTIRLTRL